MQQIGMDPAEEADFGWIAEYGLKDDVLPVKWAKHIDAATGIFFYVDQVCQITSWENPLTPNLKRIVEIGRLYLQKPAGGFFDEQRGLLWDRHKQDLDTWHGPISDDEGRQYFTNSATGVSSWEDPRIDVQYLYELENGLLQCLQEVLPAPPDPDLPEFGRREGQQTRARCSRASIAALDVSLSQTSLRLRQLAQQGAKSDRSSVLQKMSFTADWFRRVCHEDEEIQRLQITKTAAERRRRQLRAPAAT